MACIAFNAGLLASGDMTRALVPCTPAGGMVLLDAAAAALGVKSFGAEAVVVGRSNLVGKPIAQLPARPQCDGNDRPFTHPRSRGDGGESRCCCGAIGRPR